MLKSENNFNSIKVRLERNEQANYKASPIFQFHKGAIRTSISKLEITVLLYFNSIKVRLEHRIVNDYYRYMQISIP